MSEIAYADTVAWEEWQREYRYGAFYIFPPPGVIENIDLLRQRHDPKSAAICQAHISLSEPLRQPLIEADLKELQTQLASVEPFALRYGPLKTFPPYPGVTYAIAPEENFAALRSAIHATAMFSATPVSRSQIAPHMTIAEFITGERTAELLQELTGQVPEGTFLCNAVEYAVPNVHFFFERVLAISIGHDRR